MMYIRDDFQLNDFQHAVIIAIVNVVAIFGAAISGYLSSKYGRTKAIFVASLFFFVANLVMATSTNFLMLFIGRVFCGLGGGFALSISPLYISEMSPPKYRGGFVSLSEMSVNVGITVGFFIDYIFTYVPDKVAWRWMFAMGCVLPLIMMYLSICAMAETPRWLLLQHRSTDAEIVLGKMTNSIEEMSTTKVQIEKNIKIEMGFSTN